MLQCNVLLGKPGIYVNLILALGTHLKNVCRPITLKMITSLVSSGLHNTYFNKRSKNTAKNLRCSFGLQTPQTSIRWDLWEAIPLHRDPTSQSKSQKNLSIACQYQTLQDTLSCSLSRPRLVRALEELAHY